MKFKYFFIALLVFCFSNIMTAQNQYGIDFTNYDSQVCQKFNQAFSNRPKEMKFGIKRVNASLFFETNDEDWFNSLFVDAYDGIAIDIVAKDRYACNVEHIESVQIKGELLPPVYSKRLKGGLKKSDNTLYRVLVGRIPAHLLNKDLEFNTLFLSNKNLCQYYVIYDLESYPWDLLDMGMYLDSITYKEKQIKTASSDSYVIKNKSLKFKIPFIKNKAEYSQDDIRPLYDSLRLTDFNIKSINIKVYSSIEGSLERNVKLQEQRALSIVKAIQSFQKPSIKNEISSSENWVEFLNDIENTKYEDLKRLSKSQIKAKLVGVLSSEMEPILKKHRKALVTLELEKKDVYKDLNDTELLSKFNSSIASNDLDEALKIQNSLFEKLKNREVSPDVLDKMQVPNQLKYMIFLNKNAAYKYVLEEPQVLMVYNELLKLEKLAPKDKRVKYNIAVTKLKLWRLRAIDVDDKKLKAEISALKNYGISDVLITRLLVNYHVITAENLMRKRDYTNKDKAVKFIEKNYKKFDLLDYDYLSLAQFFSYYANTDLSVTLLKDKVKQIDTDENLLFYYLNLTIINPELTKTSDYRTIMLNALNMNKMRYCKLFNPFGEGGVTFQLLEDDYLRETYCESCMN
ncbi:hypothetical protein ES692_07810 [Psychroserpens burtonensis]|uniref:OmpA family protein n=1 Tax=Psychroserpens burtonensis TaxID=49278 RepID=A0A5C7B715_9FLAO|nr:hypothetical protein [Psychroserpens burtonensis]TXE17795.1 hypothetical protein ES692_07810 [Psychroserpens burtonensis]